MGLRAEVLERIKQLLNYNTILQELQPQVAVYYKSVSSTTDGWPAGRETLPGTLSGWRVSAVSWTLKLGGST